MYVYMYVCMYVCIYVCMYVCMCVCMCVCIWMYVRFSRPQTDTYSIYPSICLSACLPSLIYFRSESIHHRHHHPLSTNFTQEPTNQPKHTSTHIYHILYYIYVLCRYGNVLAAANRPCTNRRVGRRTIDARAATYGRRSCRQGL